MGLLIYRLIRVPVISVRYLCLIKDVLCDFVWFTKRYQMYIYYIHLFMSLFIIPLQSMIGKILPNLWQRRLEKPLLIVTKLLNGVEASHFSLSDKFKLPLLWTDQNGIHILSTPLYTIRYIKN